MRSGVHNPSVAALTGSTVSCPFINFLCRGTQHVTGTVSNEATSDMGRETDHPLVPATKFVRSLSCRLYMVPFCDILAVQMHLSRAAQVDSLAFAYALLQQSVSCTLHCNAPEQLV